MNLDPAQQLAMPGMVLRAMPYTAFHPEHQALKDIFSSDTTYIIPEYQRQYSWQALGKNDTNNQINQMWDDLWDFFQENDDDKEYFLGSMVIIENKRGKLEVVDGQQRITSLTLLFAAMICFLERCKALEGESKLSEKLAKWAGKAQNTLQRLIYNEGDLGLDPELKVKVERSTGYDFDSILNQAAQCQPTLNTKSIDTQYRDIAIRYFRNRDFFIDKLEENFLHRGFLGDEEATRFNEFFLFLRTRVSIISITTTDFDTAFSIFEILNNRGLPLSNKDLLRNFVINELTRARHGRLTTKEAARKWEAWDDEFLLTEDFVGRWVESTTGRKQQKSAFNSIKQLYEARYKDSPSRSKIHQLCHDLEQNLERYSLISDPDRIDRNIELRNKLKSILVLGNVRYSNDLLMSLFHVFQYTGDKSSPELDAFLQCYHRYTLYIALSPGRRFQSKKIFEAIRALRDDKVAAAMSSFSLSDRELSHLSALLGGPLDNTSGTHLLATYIWHRESRADSVIEQRLMMEKVTLEHIIPQSPEPGSDWLSLFDESFRQEYTYRLGNMTLVTKGVNSRAKNYPYAKKRVHYANTTLWMTRALAEHDELTPQLIEKRHEDIVAGLHEALGMSAPAS